MRFQGSNGTWAISSMKKLSTIGMPSFSINCLFSNRLRGLLGLPFIFLLTRDSDGNFGPVTHHRCSTLLSNHGRHFLRGPLREFIFGLWIGNFL